VAPVFFGQCCEETNSIVLVVKAGLLFYCMNLFKKLSFIFFNTGNTFPCVSSYTVSVTNANFFNFYFGSMDERASMLYLSKFFRRMNRLEKIVIASIYSIWKKISLLFLFALSLRNNFSSGRNIMFLYLES